MGRGSRPRLPRAHDEEPENDRQLADVGDLRDPAYRLGVLRRNDPGERRGDVAGARDQHQGADEPGDEARADHEQPEGDQPDAPEYLDRDDALTVKPHE